MGLTMTSYIMENYNIFAVKCHNRLVALAISSLKYFYIMFDRDVALMPVRQRIQGKSLSEVRQMNLLSSDLVIHHSDMESALSSVALCVRWWFAEVLREDGTLRGMPTQGAAQLASEVVSAGAIFPVFISGAGDKYLK